MDTQNGLWKSPYFKPYGNPCERASIPEEYEKEFSKNCLERSIYLWEEIEKLKNDNKTPDNKRTSFLNTLKNFQDHFHTSPLETQRLIVSGLVESITVDGHQISLKWRI